jgi:hypothetical protein
MTYLKTSIKPSEIRATTTANFMPTCPILLITAPNSGDQEAADKLVLSLLPFQMHTCYTLKYRTAPFIYMFVHTSEWEWGITRTHDIAEDYVTTV